jgi:6,7-dimethyl-8-ribityllumazine synthase
MAQHPEAHPSPSGRLPPGARLAAVVSTYHPSLTEELFQSARRELELAGLQGELLRVNAPGVFELPLIARRLGMRDDVHAVLCFGLVLKGETPHDRYIADAVAHALQRVALDIDKPVLFGVLTCDTFDQAEARAKPARDGGEHDKGREVAQATVGALAALMKARDIGREHRPAGFHRSEEARS